MIRSLAAATLLGLLSTGCGSDNEACLDNADAWSTCMSAASDAGLDVAAPVSDPEAFCKDFKDTPDSTWNCMADAWDSADCSTEDGLAAALAQGEGCPVAL